MSRRIFNLLILSAILAGLAACGGGSSPKQAASKNRQQDKGAPVVEAVEVKFGSLPLEERLSGSVRARNQTDIFPEVAGTIDKVLVDDGDHVKSGQPLVRLRDRDFQERVSQAKSGLQIAEARVRQAQANLIRMQANLKRAKAIVQRKLGTQEQLDTATADAATAEADLDLAKAQREQAASLVAEKQDDLADTVIRAPIDGVVGSRNAEIGQQANTNTSLFTIGDVNAMQVGITLTQKMLGYIKTGTAVNIYTDTDPDDKIQAHITRISPYLHPVTHTTDAEIHIDENDGMLLPGMFVTVDVLYGQSEQAPLIPNSALYVHPRNGREGVFVASVQDAAPDPAERGKTQFNPALYNDPLGPVSIHFVPVDVIARGRVSSGVRGIEKGDWVVTIGHNLLQGDESKQAVVQPTPWDHILDLQHMQSRDLLDIIRQKQEQNEAMNLRTD